MGGLDYLVDRRSVLTATAILSLSAHRSAVGEGWPQRPGRAVFK